MMPPDVNVLINAFRKDLPQHGVCREWLAAVVAGDARFGLSTLVLGAVVRIVTSPRAFKTPSAITETFGFCDNLLGQPHCQIVEPGERHWDIFRQLCVTADTRGGARHRRLVRGPRHRVGLRVDHARPRLRALSGIEVASAGGVTIQPRTRRIRNPDRTMTARVKAPSSR